MMLNQAMIRGLNRAELARQEEVLLGRIDACSKEAVHEIIRECDLHVIFDELNTCFQRGYYTVYEYFENYIFLDIVKATICQHSKSEILILCKGYFQVFVPFIMYFF